MTALFDQGELFPDERLRHRGGINRCNVCLGAQRLPIHDTTVTYVMKRSRWLKIGKTKHLHTRWRELARQDRQRFIIAPAAMDRREPLGIVFSIPGDVEHELHERFVDYHAAGEWFHLLGELAEWAWQQREFA